MAVSMLKYELIDRVGEICLSGAQRTEVVSVDHLLFARRHMFLMDTTFMSTPMRTFDLSAEELKAAVRIWDA